MGKVAAICVLAVALVIGSSGDCLALDITLSTQRSMWVCHLTQTGPGMFLLKGYDQYGGRQGGATGSVRIVDDHLEISLTFTTAPYGPAANGEMGGEFHVIDLLPIEPHTFQGICYYNWFASVSGTIHNDSGADDCIMVIGPPAK